MSVNELSVTVRPPLRCVRFQLLASVALDFTEVYSPLNWHEIAATGSRRVLWALLLDEVRVKQAVGSARLSAGR